jgi:enhancing lycopene biosynthesis protein 2
VEAGVHKIKRVGVVLAGCGYLDGAEVQEAVLTLLAIDRAGAQAICFAPDVDQKDVVDHLGGGQPGGSERRNVRRESARIARGAVKDLCEARAKDLDALVFPGGYGAAKNLCDFAAAGEKAVALPDVARIVREMHAAGKPMGFICIAPAIAAAVFRGTQVHLRMTVGTDAETSSALERMGARPGLRTVQDIEVDPEHKVVTTPAYMLAERISDAAAGIDKLIDKVLFLTE